MDLLPLISISAIFFLVALVKPHIKQKVPFNICSICTAVSATWIILLILWALGSEVSLISIGILMGMSVSGAMYRIGSFYEKRKIKNYWLVRVVIVISAFYFIHALLQKQWNLLILLPILSLFIIAIASLFFQGTTRKNVVSKLEDCC